MLLILIKCNYLVLHYKKEQNIQILLCRIIMQCYIFRIVEVRKVSLWISYRIYFRKCIWFNKLNSIVEISCAMFSMELRKGNLTIKETWNNNEKKHENDISLSFIEYLITYENEYLINWISWNWIYNNDTFFTLLKNNINWIKIFIITHHSKSVEIKFFTCYLWFFCKANMLCFVLLFIMLNF